VSNSPPISECRRGIRLRAGCSASALTLAFALTARTTHATGKQGEFIQTDTLGVSLLSQNLDTRKTRTLRDVVNLSEIVGLHGYAVDRLRFGASIQMSERLWPEPPSGGRIQRVAVLPQVGWNFFDPFFTAFVFGFAPRTDGKVHLNLTLQGVLGVSLPLSSRVRFSLAGEVPWTFYDHHLLGVTALTGLSFRL
jgi:hypothetical protein